MKQSSVYSFFKKSSTGTPASPTRKLISFPWSNSEPSSNFAKPICTLNPSKKTKADVDVDTYSNRHREYDSTKRNRVYQPSWKHNNAWLAYDPEADLMWCKTMLRVSAQYQCQEHANG